MAMSPWEVTLVNAAKAGDSAAFTELYEQYYKADYAVPTESPR